MEAAFTLTGTDCDSCAAAVPVTIQRVDGVEQASMEDDRLTVVHDDATIAEGDIITLLEDVGYGVDPGVRGDRGVG